MKMALLIKAITKQAKDKKQKTLNDDDDNDDDDDDRWILVRKQQSVSISV